MPDGTAVASPDHSHGGTAYGTTLPIVHVSKTSKESGVLVAVLQGGCGHLNHRVDDDVQELGSVLSGTAHEFIASDTLQHGQTVNLFCGHGTTCKHACLFANLSSDFSRSPKAE